MAKHPAILDGLGWKWIKDLGEGGQASVYLVSRKSDPDGKRFVAKALRSKEGSQAYSRFHQEIEALRLLNHPAIVKVVDDGHDEAEDFHIYTSRG